MRLLSGLVVLSVQYFVFTGAVLAENIVINEFDLNPAGKDTGNEWVVLYNPSEVEVDITQIPQTTSLSFRLNLSLIKGLDEI